MRVVGLCRYPVKSMQGEALESAEIDDLGVLGDRQCALVDTDTGLTLTARRVPELLFATARWRNGDVEIELPDGTTTADDGDLSTWLGRSVVLRRAGPGLTGRYEIAADFEHEDASRWVQWDGPEGGPFHDDTHIRVSVLSTGSMHPWEHRRFRANIVVDADAGTEDALVGATVEVGSVQLDVVTQISRCVMTTRPQPGIERDLDVLRTINAQRDSFLGVGALVTHPGTVRLGDDLHRLAP